MSLREHLLVGAAWSMASHSARSLLGIVSLAVMAAILGPQVYGTFGAIWLLVGIAQIPLDGAFGIGLVQRRDLDDGHLDLTFALTMALAILLAGLLTAAATPLATVVDAAGAVDALVVLAWVLPLTAAGNVPAALLSRTMRFRASAIVGTAAATAGAVTGIAAVLLGAGLWSFVVAAYARIAVQSLGCLAIVSWRPRLRFKFRHLRDLGGFNLKVLATYLAGHASDLAPRFLVSSLLGAQALGYYNLALRIAGELIDFVTGPFNAVALPAVAALRDRLEEVPRLLVQLYRATSLLVYPAMLGALVIAPLLVPLVFGEAWLPAVPLLQLMLLAGLRTSIATFNFSVLQGLGLPGRPVLLFATSLVVRCLVLLALLPLGVRAAGIAFLVAALAIWPLGAVMMRDAAGMTLGHQLRPLVPAAASAACMAAVIAAMAHWLAQAVPEPVAALACVGAGPVLYLGVLAFGFPDTAALLQAVAGALVRRDRDALRGALIGIR